MPPRALLSAANGIGAPTSVIEYFRLALRRIPLPTVNALHLPLESILGIILVSSTLDVWLKPHLELLNAQLLSVPFDPFILSRHLLWRHENVADDVQDGVLGNSILDHDSTVAVDLHADEWSESRDVDWQAAIIEQGRQIDVHVFTRRIDLDVVCIVTFIEGVAIKCLVGHDVVLEQSLEVLEARLREEESVGTGPELLEGEVVGREDSAADMWRLVQLLA